MFTEPEKPTVELEFTPIATIILKKLPTPKALENLSQMICCTSGSGTRADMLQKRLKPLSDLCKHNNSAISIWAKKLHNFITVTINKEYRLIPKGKHTYQSFE